MNRLEKLERLANVAIALKDHLDNNPYTNRMINYTREEFLVACGKYRTKLQVLEEEYNSALQEVKGE